MNIIFDEKNADVVSEKHTVLELETYRIKDRTLKTFAALEPKDIKSPGVLDNTIRNHNKLMENFYKQNWNFCEQMIPHLKGQFSEFMDEFYDHMSNRIQELKTQKLPSDWDGTVTKG